VFTAVTLGDAHTCGLRNDGVVLCWGSNQNGRIGDATTADRLEPTPTANPGSFAAVAAGGSHTCALTTTGAALCWGNGNSGQLGTGTATPQQIVPVPVAGSTLFDRLSAGFAHTCALQADGKAYCWGSNGSGRLGDGTTTLRPAPVAVVGGAKFAVIAAGAEHTCGRSTAGSAICWGRNQEGQLGDNSTAARSSPSGVKRP
jgi:alpha-tubulin suppressor-like RCC1 family protein